MDLCPACCATAPARRGVCLCVCRYQQYPFAGSTALYFICLFFQAHNDVNLLESEQDSIFKISVALTHFPATQIVTGQPGQ